MKNYVVVGFLLFSNSIFAETTDNLGQAEIHKNKAQILINQKDWTQALVEVKQATTLNDKDQDSWLIQGTVAARLEQNELALSSFEKYLELKPPENKASLVRKRVAELQVLVEQAKVAKAQAEAVAAEARSKKYGAEGNGFFIGFSPSYKTKISTSSDLESDLDSTFDLGLRSGNLDVGFRMGSGKVKEGTGDSEDVLIADQDLINGKHSLFEFFFRYNFPMGQPALPDRGFHYYIPLHMSMFYNTVTFDRGATTDTDFKEEYFNMGYNLGSGVQARYFTGSTFSFDLTGLYYLSIPFSGIINNDGEIVNVKNAKGKDAKGSMQGFELRLGVTFMF